MRGAGQLEEKQEREKARREQNLKRSEQVTKILKGSEQVTAQEEQANDIVEKRQSMHL